jgi:hypothetical protein
LVTAFGEMTDLLDAINARGLACLKPEFLKRTPFEITQEAERTWYMRDTKPVKIIGELTKRSAPPDPDKFDELDRFLGDIIGSVKDTCDSAMGHVRDDDQTVVEQALVSATEMLAEVMAGRVDDWID